MASNSMGEALRTERGMQLHSPKSSSWLPTCFKVPHLGHIRIYPNANMSPKTAAQRLNLATLQLCYPATVPMFRYPTLAEPRYTSVP